MTLGRCEFPVFSFTTPIGYEKGRRHDVSVKKHLSANESAITMLNFFTMSHLGGYADAFVR